MPIGPARMPLFDHLGELRMRLVRIVVCLLVGVCVFYFATPTMGQFLMIPIAEYLPKGPDGLPSFMAIDPFEAFSTRFKISIWAAIVACSPVILWQLLAFFLPALKPNERKWVVPTVAAMVVLFFLGMIFCYFVIQSAAFGWLLDQSFEFAQNLANAEDYLNIYMMLEIGFGIAFQLPLVIFYLSILHVVPYKTFRSQWRYVYVALMLLSAVVTPDASPITMLLMFAALIALYEVALAVARYIIIARDGKAALKWSRADYEQHALDND